MSIIQTSSLRSPFLAPLPDSVSGFLTYLPALASHRASSTLYLPHGWTRTSWIRFLLKASNINALGVNLSSHCIDGPVALFQPGSPMWSVGNVSRSLESAYRQACGGKPVVGGKDSPALVLNPPDAPSSFPVKSTELERFLLRQGVAYEFVIAPTHLCEQVSWLQRPWRAAFSVDGPHLLHMVSLAPKTPLYVAFTNVSNAAIFCSLGASMGSRWHAVIGSSIFNCATPTQPLASPAQHVFFVEAALSCYSFSSPHCQTHYPHTLDLFASESMLAVRAAEPSIFTSAVKIGPRPLETIFYTNVWPVHLAKFLSKITTVVMQPLRRWFAAKPPNWTTLFNPKMCSTGGGVDAPTFPMETTWKSLRPTPYDPAVWHRLGDPSLPAPNMFVISYNTMMGGMACMCLKTALRLGYQINYVGYWRSKAFDYMCVTRANVHEEMSARQYAIGLTCCVEKESVFYPCCGNSICSSTICLTRAGPTFNQLHDLLLNLHSESLQEDVASQYGGQDVVWHDDCARLDGAEARRGRGRHL